MPAANAFVRGHQEVGHVASSTDVPWGKTAEDAVSIQMNVQTVDLFSAQSKMNEDTGITQIGMDIVIKGIDGALRNIQRAFGLPDSAFTGDLSNITPSDEVLEFNEDEIGETERAIYSEGPGPLASTRRIDAPRCKLVSVGALAQSKTGWMLPEATWRVLNPGSSTPVVTITDIVAS